MEIVVYLQFTVSGTERTIIVIFFFKQRYIITLKNNKRLIP